MRILLLFLDGVGLGADDPVSNPFVTANTPTLWALAGGKKWLRDTPRLDSGRSLFIPTDPRLGVPGRPQSATNQAVILTGRNVPAEIGEHYGPKPNPPVRAILAQSDNVFKRLVALGKSAAVLDAYPPRFFERIERGKTLRSSIQQAAYEAGIPLMGEEDLRRGDALSVDWTGEGWRTELGFSDTPVYSRHEAGVKLAQIAGRYDFSFFSHWVTDEIGHRGPLERGVGILELIDGVMAGLLDAWDDQKGFVITSDHGNLEDLSTRHHTENDVPTVVIGAGRESFGEGLRALTDLAPHIMAALS